MKPINFFKVRFLYCSRNIQNIIFFADRVWNIFFRLYITKQINLSIFIALVFECEHHISEIKFYLFGQTEYSLFKWISLIFPEHETRDWDCTVTRRKSHFTQRNIFLDWRLWLFAAEISQPLFHQSSKYIYISIHNRCACLLQGNDEILE